ncbi:MAG: zinc metalloprotease HtpX [Gammaproteobacteria bacterium]|nr:zinc metalloprotease HtpX [Gammaproteobacteria bacterium]
MDIPSAKYYQRQNTLHSLLLLSAMLGLLALIGWLVAGSDGLLLAFAVGIVIIISGPRISPFFILQLYRAQPISSQQAPQLYAILYQLADRAKLEHLPALYYFPSQVMNAFTLGLKKDTCIVISDGMLRQLNHRELTAVLAHEVSHIRNRDLRVMLIADVLSRLTSLLALAGYLLILLYLPVLIISQQPIPWLLLLMLVLAPNISALLQLALSRTREYSADLVASQLTGDPAGLAAALIKIEHYQNGWIERLIAPGRRLPDPSLLRSHPATQQRIYRLKKLATDAAHKPLTKSHDVLKNWRPSIPVDKPRRRISGLWY